MGKNKFGGLPVPAVAVCQVNRAGAILEELFRAGLISTISLDKVVETIVN